MAIKVVLVLIIVSGEVAGAPSWPSWATQVNLPVCASHKSLEIYYRYLDIYEEMHLPI